MPTPPDDPHVRISIKHEPPERPPEASRLVKAAKALSATLSHPLLLLVVGSGAISLLVESYKSTEARAAAAQAREADLRTKRIDTALSYFELMSRSRTAMEDIAFARQQGWTTRTRPADLKSIEAQFVASSASWRTSSPVLVYKLSFLLPDKAYWIRRDADRVATARRLAANVADNLMMDGSAGTQEAKRTDCDSILKGGSITQREHDVACLTHYLRQVDGALETFAAHLGTWTGEAIPAASAAPGRLGP